MVIGTKSKDSFQALTEVVLLHEAPGPMVAINEMADEFGMETIPARENIVALLDLSCEILGGCRAQVPDRIP
ncbi:hypothetical protein AU467_10985 [Mesorhizobium loti]|uniref:Uncharacterized protein n=1 Tax=Rhizobium loti TaxID=381 RepID=A0A101KXB3_RHILI|nr:hypothetical protein AU467_10985 [Mesorhizobium loti]